MEGKLSSDRSSVGLRGQLTQTMVMSMLNADLSPH